MKWFIPLFLILAIVYLRGQFFSTDAIAGSLFSAGSQAPNEESLQALSQPYRYLGKGKQAFAFCSNDGKWVLKFFNQKYIRLPFWAAPFSKERIKREKRQKFYLQSYCLAETKLAKETAIAYLHLGPAPTPLPILKVTDKKGQSHEINLNEVPFVLQKRAESFYPALNSLSSENLEKAIRDFVSLIALRIEQKIGDGDHDVEHNFGMLSGNVVQIDPGRLYVEERLWDEDKLKYEWWSGTHQLRKWLEKHHPEKITVFDNAIETNLQRVLRRSLISPPLQKDETREG